VARPTLQTALHTSLSLATEQPAFANSTTVTAQHCMEEPFAQPRGPRDAVAYVNRGVFIVHVFSIRTAER
jgi:hypothetical protein